MRDDDRMLEVLPVEGDMGGASGPVRTARPVTPVLFLIAVLVGLMVGGAGFILQSEQDPGPTTQSAVPHKRRQQPVTPTSQLPRVPSQAWRATAQVDPIERSIALPVAVAADKFLFVWSGPAPFQVDIATGARSAVPPPPIHNPDERVALWTGNEVLLWGDDKGSGRALAAFDPTVQRWRLLPAPPAFAPRHPLVSAWTGQFVVLWGERRGETVGGGGGARLDIAAGRWFQLPRTTVLNQGNGVWTGEHLIIVGSYLDSSNSASNSAVALGYDPTINQWITLPDPPLSPQATWLTMVNDSVVAWDYELGVHRLGADEKAWSALARPPMRTSECYPAGGQSSTTALFAFCNQSALLDGTDFTWHSATPPAPIIGTPVALPGGGLLVWTEMGPFTLDPSELIRR